MRLQGDNVTWSNLDDTQHQITSVTNEVREIDGQRMNTGDTFSQFQCSWHIQLLL